MVGAEVLLAHPIREPKESHVHGLGALAVRLALRDAQCHGVVHAEGCCGLGVA